MTWWWIWYCILVLYFPEAEADEYFGTLVLYFGIVLLYLVLYFGYNLEAEAGDLAVVCTV